MLKLKSIKRFFQIGKFNKALKVLLATNAVILIAGAMLGPIYALFVEQIGGDLLDASYAYGVYAMTAAVVTFLAGKFADRMKRSELVVIVGYTIIGIGFLGYTQVNSMAGLLIVQVIIGLGEAIYSPAFDALYSSHLRKDEFGKDWGAWESMAYFISSIGALIGGAVVSTFNFYTMFIIMAILAFGSALYILRLPRRVL